MTMASASPQDMIETSVRAYELDRPKHETYCHDVKRIISEILRESDIPVHSIECRAKSVDSFRNKISKKNEDGTPKYKCPLKEITDLAAVRIIVFTTSLLPRVCEAIEQTFCIHWKKDIGEERSYTKDFGYQSIHYLVYHSNDRLKLKDYSKFKGMLCEIQVRTILQHAWAEIEHDIQYKSGIEIPKEIARKFRALAGLIEIADREFQSIQDIDTALKEAVQKSAASELTISTINQLESKTAHADESETHERIYDRNEIIKKLTSARTFILEKRYEEALQVFNDNIAISPSAHTQYIGRAKVKFLLGDRSGALEDIAEAERLSPDDPALPSIRQQVEQGSINPPLANSTDAGRQNREGNIALSEGRTELAFASYSKAHDMGHNYALSIFNKSMACALAGDVDGGQAYLDQLKRIPETPMEINIVALRCILASFNDVDPTSQIDELTQLVSQKVDFDIALSPLKYLRAGLINRYGSLSGPVDRVFSILSKTSDPTDHITG